MAGFADLSTELVEQIFLAALQGSPTSNAQQLQRLQLVNSSFEAPARRLLFRWVTIDSPAKGTALLRTLEANPTFGGYIRSLIVKDGAFTQPSVFSDISQDDLLRLSPNLQVLDSPYTSFAPLSDGRQPLVNYPATLRSCAPGVPHSNHRIASYSDDESDDDYVSQQQQSTQDYTRVLSSLPANLTSLKLSKLPDNTLPFNPPSTVFPLQHLTSLSLDFVTVSPSVFTWIAEANNLEKVQLWCTRGLTEKDIVQFVQKVGRSIKSFLFKPKGGKQGSNPGNLLVGHLPKLENLTLGDKACDHNVYSNLPSTLRTLCVSLPTHHANARLMPVATEINSRLTKLVRLELYSHLYFPPPLDIAYPPPESGDPSSLRELRLSHIVAAPGQLEAFLAAVGSSLYTLAMHHISVNPTSLLPSCPSLRRLELGAHHYTLPVPSFFDYVSSQHLNYVRIHFAAGVNLAHLVSTSPSLASKGLQTLELVGVFPQDLDDEWLSGKSIDALVEACEDGKVEFLVNSRSTGTMGELWRALVGQTGRETL
ncbi:hypothetical protein JCM8547_000290 [Rhodosporidiobolus lusitaniae]